MSNRFRDGALWQRPIHPRADQIPSNFSRARSRPVENQLDFARGVSHRPRHICVHERRAQFDPVTGKVTGEIIRRRPQRPERRFRPRRKHAQKSAGEREVPHGDVHSRSRRRQNRLQGSLKSPDSRHLRYSRRKHELTIPAEVTFTADHWTAKSTFDIPYVQWGMKNPSNFFLHVPDNVRMEIELSGHATVPAAN